MSQTLLWLLLAFAVALVLVVAVLYRELKNQHHIWHDPCVTPDQARGDIGIVLRVFHEVLKDKDVVWWLDYGTLLGAWRVNGPMAFDHDVDISFLGIHEPQIRACRDEFARHGVEIDLERTSIFYRGRKIGDFERWRQYGHRLCRDDPGRRSGIMKFWRPLVDDFPVDWIAPRWGVRYDGLTFPCPNRPDRFLRHRYLTCRLHLRLVIPHKQKCWLCQAFWQEAGRILRFRPAPLETGYRPAIPRPS
jgi:hypothetical protein